MNCTPARAEIAAHGIRSDPRLLEHVRTCDLCRAWYEDFRLASALCAEPVPEPAPGFVDRVLHEAARTAPARRRRYRMAAAAAVVLSLAGGLAAVLGPREAGPGTIMTAAPAEVPRIINVVIEAGDHRRNALVTVEVTEGLEIDGYSGRRRIEWRTDLVRGRNLLALPVRGITGAGGDVRVALSYEDRTTRELRIPVKAG